jgi:hypothetical protein
MIQRDNSSALLPLQGNRYQQRTAFVRLARCCCSSSRPSTVCTPSWRQHRTECCMSPLRSWCTLCCRWPPSCLRYRLFAFCCQRCMRTRLHRSSAEWTPVGSTLHCCNCVGYLYREGNMRLQDKLTGQYRRCRWSQQGNRCSRLKLKQHPVRSHMSLQRSWCKRLLHRPTSYLRGKHSDWRG